MKLKDSIILVVVFIIAIALGVFLGIKVTERKTDNNNNNQPTQSENDNKNNDDNKNDDVQFKLSNSYEFFKTQDECIGTICTVEVKIIDSENMIFMTSTNNGVIELTKGTYIIDNNTLKYTRMYVSGSKADLSKEQYDWMQKKNEEHWTLGTSYNEKDKLEFSIDKTNNTLTLLNYEENTSLVLKPTK